MGDDRKARLKALAARAGRTKEPDHVVDDGETVDDNGATDSVPPNKANIVFRNYAPTDKSLNSKQREQSNEEETESTGPSSKRPRTQGSDTQPSSASSDNAPFSSSKALHNALREARQDATASMPAAANSATSTGNANTNKTAAATVTSMAPKKINWDLKRDISDKLAKLERRTQKAIVGMLKERLELEAAKAVNDEDSNDDDDSDLD